MALSVFFSRNINIENEHQFQIRYILLRNFASINLPKISTPLLSSTFKNRGGFPGGAVLKNPPANAGDTGSSPGPGRSHVPRSN